MMGTFRGGPFLAASLPAVLELLAAPELCSLCHWSNEDAKSEGLKISTLSILSSVWRVTLFCFFTLLLAVRLGPLDAFVVILPALESFLALR